MDQSHVGARRGNGLIHGSLRHTAIKDLLPMGQKELCLPGDVLCHEGDSVSHLLYVERGHLFLSKHADDGRVCLVDLVGPGGVVGDEAIEQDVCSFVAVGVATECRVLRVPIGAIRTTAGGSVTLTESLRRLSVQARVRLSERLIALHTLSTSQRLGSLLLELEAPDGDGVLAPINPRLSHERLAELVGTTRPRVTVLMKQFRRQGFLTESGSELVVSPALRDVVDGASRGRAGNRRSPDHLEQLLTDVRELMVRRVEWEVR